MIFEVIAHGIAEKLRRSVFQNINQAFVRYELMQLALFFE